MNPAPRYVARLVCQSQYHVILSLFTTDSSTGVTDTSGLAPVVHDASLIVAALMMKPSHYLHRSFVENNINRVTGTV